MAWTDYYVDQSDDSATGGAGSAADPWTSLRAAVAEIGAIAGPTRIFVRNSGTTLGSALDISTAGTSANPVLWIGCTGTGTTWTRIGNDASAAKPTVACSTYQVTISGAYQSFEGLGFSGATTTASGQVKCTGNYQTFVRCRCINTAANTNSRGMTISGAYSRVILSYISADNTTTYYALFTEGTQVLLYGNVCKGGDVAAMYVAGQGSCAAFNLCYGMGDPGDGIRFDVSGQSYAIHNTIYGGHEDGIRISQAAHSAVGNLCVGTGDMDYPINYSNATATHVPLIALNAWYNVGTDKINGIVETQATHDGAANDYGNLVWNYGLLAADPLPNAATLGDASDFILASSAKALAGIAYEAGEYAYVSYNDHGAMQRQEDYPTEANARYGVTYGGLGATSGSKALTGAIEMPNTDSPTGTQDATSDACVVSGKKYGSPQRTGSAAGGGGGGARIIGG